VVRCRWTVAFHNGREYDHPSTCRLCIMQCLSSASVSSDCVCCAVALWGGRTYVEDCVHSTAVPSSSAEEVYIMNDAERQLSNFSYLERVCAAFHLSGLNIFFVSVANVSRRNVASPLLTQSKCVHQSRERFANVPSVFLMLHWP